MSTAPAVPTNALRAAAQAPSSSAHPRHSVDASALRAQIESAHGGRLAGALTPVPRQVRETLQTGISTLDTMIGGGVPLGAITELVGPNCSGRTGVALSTLASAMREGSMCAWVDASDALDPESAAANGVRLEQLLWVRCGVQGGAPETRHTGGTRTSTSSVPPHTHARAGHHPRDEERGLDRAVGELLGGPGSSRRHDRSIGTPGALNRPLVSRRAPSGGSQMLGPVQREEQVSSDRQPKRRSSILPTPVLETHRPVAFRSGKVNHATGAPWTRLDQALRAADLLLQAGGFRVLVLDLGNIAPEHALRIPLATWFRFRAAAEASRTVLLALLQTSCAKSSAGLLIQFEALTPQPWSAQPAASERENGVLPFPDRQPIDTMPLAPAVAPDSNGQLSPIESVCYQAHLVRQRFAPSPEHGVTEQDRPPSSMHHQSAPHPGRRQPQATWQLTSFPLHEEAGSA